MKKTQIIIYCFLSLLLSGIIFILLLLPSSEANINALSEAVQPDHFVMNKDSFMNAPYGLDSNGILFYDYGTRYNNLGRYHNPTFIAAYANALYLDIVRGDKTLVSDFTKQVDYLLSTAKSDPDGGLYWTYPFENPYYKAPKEWYSAMTSGRILGVLTRAHYLTNNDKYLTAAKKVYRKMSKSSTNSGMTTYTKHNEAWFEEVSYPNSESFKVLNGHIFALSGLYDYACYVNDIFAKQLAYAGFNAVLSKLDYFDAGFISYYCENMPGREKSYAELHGYHAIHVLQILYCYLITDNPLFLKKAMRFQLYENFNPNINASFTTNSETHGTDKMNLTFGNNYWSSYRFPVSVTMDFKDKIFFDDITIIGRTRESLPKSYTLYKKYDNYSWEEISGDIYKGDKILKIHFSKPQIAEQMKVNIQSSYNGPLALEGIGIHRSEGDLSPLFVWNEMQRGIRHNYNLYLSRLFDENQDTFVQLQPKSNIALIIPCRNKNISVKGNFLDSNSEVLLFYSEDLENWTEQNDRIELNKIGFNYQSHNNGFIKLQIKTELKLSISEVDY